MPVASNKTHHKLQQMASQIAAANASAERLQICGNASKQPTPKDQPTLPLAEYAGIVTYDPSELVITVRAGTTVSELQQILGEKDQVLAFEPPHSYHRASIGGVIACGLSGPARPFLGTARDAVLGIKMINGVGEVLNFGGQVMKNVAGFDVPRLLCGSRGSLGAIVEISLRVMPKKEATQTLVFDMPMGEAIVFMNRRAGQPWPLTAASWYDQRCYLRLSGAQAAVEEACGQIGGSKIDAADYWQDLNEKKGEFFSSANSLWHLIVPATAVLDVEGGHWLVDWCGRRRWLSTDALSAEFAQQVHACGGHIEKCMPGNAEAIAREPQGLEQLLRRAFDPNGVFVCPWEHA